MRAHVNTAGGYAQGIEQTPNKFAVLASPAAALLAPIRVAKSATRADRAKRRAAKRDAVTPTAADDDESGYLGSAEAERDVKAMADCDAFYEYILAAPRPPAYYYSSDYPGLLAKLDVAGARAIDGAAAAAAALAAPVPAYGDVPRCVGLPLHAAAALKLALPRAARPVRRLRTCPMSCPAMRGGSR